MAHFSADTVIVSKEVLGKMNELDLCHYMSDLEDEMLEFDDTSHPEYRLLQTEKERARQLLFLLEEEDDDLADEPDFPESIEWEDFGESEY